jgi:putative Ca2+/H+ antiporter (TMEM165/GDT1 family)
MHGQVTLWYCLLLSPDSADLWRVGGGSTDAMLVCSPVTVVAGSLFYSTWKAFLFHLDEGTCRLQTLAVLAAGVFTCHTPDR